MSNFKHGNRMEFNYVEITARGYEGCVNLFIGEHVLALVNNVYLSSKVKKEVARVTELAAKVEELEAENERLFKSTNFIVEKKQEIEEEFRGFREEAYPLVNALRERVAELNAHIEGINTVVGAAQELINNAEWDGDISTVDTGDLKALQSALLEPLRG